MSSRDIAVKSMMAVWMSCGDYAVEALREA